MMSSSNKTKVLFLSLSGIGNYLMQSATIAALRKAKPEWHITVWVAPRGTSALANNDANVDEVIEMPIQCSPGQHLKQLVFLRKQRFDIGIVLSPGQLIKSAIYLRLSNIPKRIGYSYPLNNNPHSAFLLTDALQEDNEIHDIEQNFTLLSALEITTPQRSTYSLTIPEKNNTLAMGLVKDFSLSPERPVIGIHAGSAQDLAFKRWPLTHFATVASKLISTHDATILLFGGPAEEKQKKELQQLIYEQTRSSHVHIVSEDLLTVAALMRHCTVFLANDSGLMHVAAAVGAKTIGLFGPTDEHLTGPRGEHTSTIRAPHTKPIYKTEQKVDWGSEPHETMKRLSPSSVLDRLASYV